MIRFHRLNSEPAVAPCGNVPADPLPIPIKFAIKLAIEALMPRFLSNWNQR